MKLLAILSAVVALAVTSIWAFRSPGFDSVGAAAAALSALVGTLFLGKKDHSLPGQTVAAGGLGIQAGRDVTVSDVTVGK